MPSSLLDLLNVRYPLFQAPMAGTSTPALTAAVSNAGALGGLAVGHVDAPRARALIAQTRALTSLPFVVNLFCHAPPRYDKAANQRWLDHLAPYFAEFGATPPSELKLIYNTFANDDDMLEMLLQERPKAVSFHFGLPPQDRIDALKRAGIVLASAATTREEARQVQDAGIDIIIAQGYEAGGHRGIFDQDRDDAIPTLELLKAILADTTCPVAAAGGLMDGADMARALAAGASAVQMGTAFVLCPESSANAAYRAALKSDRARRTEVTTAISGRPARGIVNRMIDEAGAPGSPPAAPYPYAYDAGKALNEAAAAQGSDAFAAQWAGQGAARARELPAAELVRVILEEWQGATA